MNLLPLAIYHRLSFINESLQTNQEMTQKCIVKLGVVISIMFA